MSLVGTLAKLAVGAMVAKGVGSAMRGGGGSGGGLGGLLGGALGGAMGGGNQQGGSGGGLLGGNNQQGGSSGGGLGGLLGGALGGGGLGDLGSLLGGGSTGNASPGGAGGLGGLLESISGGGQATNAQAPSGGSLGDLLNGALTGQNAAPTPTPTQEELAKILISALIAGTKSDGNVDQAEQAKIVEHLGNDVDEAERQFVLAEMQAPLDVDALVASIPKGSEQQAYMMSLMGITLDTQEEAKFLDAFRKGLGMTEEVANAIHQQLGAPTLYG